ncbi:uncharacterized protein HMPREF1541_09901 [Cyphellophora europaea CBS 101466]|uniref:Uncharacterized protein n=1 Tax=Cyphellophora europaea (strain CBS 101466) TaxID=1220924 RepID=W2S8R6_CYPE1|nr:uncharacterized protein HMPREF1541_09901 [Cyphellophora europaea CBS 101466]ETN45025.1 hypothetical protein HMPREF1541_09901 [Cyphellophora europaea CBS 101466]
MQLPKTISTPAATVPCSTDVQLSNAAGDEYLIQVSWPLAWEDNVDSRPSVPIFYVLDGNAHFFTLVETVRRGLAVAASTDAVVVGIGYPDCGHYVFGNRRGYDLTPPTSTYVPPRSWDGKEFTLPHGGATELLDFIQNIVRPHLLSEILPGFQPVKEVLAGHSFGGLCALHALFSHAYCFDTFIAISPTIWWNDHFLLREEKDFVQHMASHSGKRPLSLYLSYGYYEQYPKRRKTYSDEEYAKRLAHALSLRTNDDIEDMADRLGQSNLFNVVKAKGYADEDHGSVAACGLGWAVCDALDDDRFA